MEGDIVVVGSDGLFDNVFDTEIVSIVSESQDVAEAGLFSIHRSRQFCLAFYLLLILFFSL